MKPYNVVKWPAKILETKCEDVPSDVWDHPHKAKKLKEICSRMMVTVMRSKAIGLAANQIGADVRIIAVKTIGPGMDPGGFMGVMINPSFVSWSTESKSDLEGCLSFPGEQARVNRSEQVTVQFLTPDGAQRCLTFSGLTARCIQHEMDHLNGVTMRMKEDEQRVR